uniref:collagen alpha-1(XII) chain-like isoform X2 n=1 Tax=Myxine glutinosa TaxID=7769 RepID=UPI00358E0FB7
MKSAVSTALVVLVVLGMWTASGAAQNRVAPPHYLRFRVLNASSVHVSWKMPRGDILGYRITVVPSTGGPPWDKVLRNDMTETVVGELKMDVKYLVNLVSYNAQEESAPVLGEIIIQKGTELLNKGRNETSEEDAFEMNIACADSVEADVIFVVPGDAAIPRFMSRRLRPFLVALASALPIHRSNTRIAMMQYTSSVQTKIPLVHYTNKQTLQDAIKAMPTMPGVQTNIGRALAQVLPQLMPSQAGPRVGAARAAVVLVAGPSWDPIVEPAKELQKAGIEVFAVGLGAVGEAQLKSVASSPLHVFQARTSEELPDMLRNLTTRFCAGLQMQLEKLRLGEIAPPREVQLLHVTSHSMRVVWHAPDGSIVTGYRVSATPKAAGQTKEINVGPTKTTAVVWDLEPEEEYEIKVFSLFGAAQSVPVVLTDTTKSTKVTVECTSYEDIRADVLFLVDGSYSIGLDNFSKVRAFLRTLASTFHVGTDHVRLGLVQYSREPHLEFGLAKHTDRDAVLRAIAAFPYRGGSTNTGRAMTYVHSRVLTERAGARLDVPQVMILVTDGKSSDSFRIPAERLKSSNVEIFAVGVKDAERAELEAIATPPSNTHVYTVEDFDAFEHISAKLAETICLRIEQEMEERRQRTLIPPRDLVTSEVTTNSFRATWVPGRKDVLAYWLWWAPAGGVTMQARKLTLSSNQTTTVLPGLWPGTRYTIKVFAMYEDGESIPLEGEETTLDVQGSPQDLQVSEETQTSFRVSWLPAPGDVAAYELRFVPAEGGLPGGATATGHATSTVLTNLIPGARYLLRVWARYSGGDGPPLDGQGSTLHETGPPRDLTLTDVSVSSIRASWKAASGPVQRYTIRYWPESVSVDDEEGSGEPEVGSMVVVPGNVTTTFLENLKPDTLYHVTVSANYPESDGMPAEAVERTYPEMGAPTNLRTQAMARSLAVSWKAAPGRPKAYVVRYKSRLSDQDGERHVTGTDTDVVLSRLQPETPYRLSVMAVYHTGQGPPLEGQAVTKALESAEELMVSERSTTGFRVTWKAAPGPVVGYRVSHRRKGHRGRPSVLRAPRNVTSVRLRRLQPGTTYDLRVLPMYNDWQGQPRSGKGSTLKLLLPPDNFRTSEVQSSGFRVTWDGPEAGVQGYLVTYHPNSKKYESRNVTVGPMDSSVVLQGLSASTPYEVNVISMYDEGLSEPLNGSEVTAFPEEAAFECASTAYADIVILVDGSWSIGRLNFHLVRQFIKSLVQAFDIESGWIRVGLAQYSGDPRNEWELNQYSTKNETLKAVGNFSYKGGNTLTGRALDFIREYSFVKARKNVVKIGILITDGKSQDDVAEPAQNLRNEDVTVFAIGVKNADENELKLIASEPLDDHIYIVADFSGMSSIVGSLTQMLCHSVDATEPGDSAPHSPSDLRTSDITTQSFRVSWSPATGSVDRYQVTYHPASESKANAVSMVVDHSTTSVVLPQLNPKTQYSVYVTAESSSGSSQPLTGQETTLPLSKISNGRTFDVTPTSMRVKWSMGPGASSYHVTYSPFLPDGRYGKEREVKVGGADVETTLTGLDPRTRYRIMVQAMYGEHSSQPLVLEDTTLPLAGPRHLRFSSITSSGFKASWDAAPGPVTRYRIVYSPKGSVDSKEIEVPGRQMDVVLHNLNELTEYDVSVFAVYPEGESDALNGREATLSLAAASDLRFSDVTHNGFKASWQAAPGRVSKYRVVYSPKGTRDSKEVEVRRTDTLLKNLNPLTSYDVSVYAIYPDGESTALRGSETTLPLGGARGLRFPDISHSTIRVTWDPAVGPVNKYRIVYSPKDSHDSKEMEVRGRRTEVLLPELNALTEYDVSVIAIYPEGESNALMGSESTRAIPGPRKIRFFDTTHNSFRVSWEPAPGSVTKYHIVYSRKGSEEPLEEEVRGSATQIVLPDLTSQTEYEVSISAVYPDGVSDPLVGSETTLNPPSPKSLRISDATTSSFRVTWDHGGFNPMLYRLKWRPFNGEHFEETILPGNSRSYIINNLDQRTLYSVELSAIYPDETETDPTIKTEEWTLTITTTTPRATTTPAPRSGPRNLVTSEERINSFRVSWDHAIGNVHQYRIVYAPQSGSRPPQAVTTSGQSSTAVLHNLLPDTPYHVSVHSLYSFGEGGSVDGTARTLQLLSPRNLHVSDERHTRFRVDWDRVPVPTQGYKVVYQPLDGGRQMETFVGDVGHAVLHHLTPGTRYNVSVFSVYPSGMSEPLVGIGTTVPLEVTDLTVTRVGTNTVCLSWKPQLGVYSYRLTWEQVAGGYPREVSLSGRDRKYCVPNLYPDTHYSFSLTPRTAQAKGSPSSTTQHTMRRTTTAPPTTTTTPAPTIPPAREECRNAKADIVFLVDGSWSIGEPDFRKVIQFLYSTVGALDKIGPDGTQVGITQFSHNARTEFYLNKYLDKETLLNSILAIRFKGGNTNIGRALKHTHSQLFKEEAGLRKNLPKVLVMLTDGRSLDDAQKIASDVRTSGVTVFVIGLMDVDYAELAAVASKPVARHLFFVENFNSFQKIQDELIAFICETASSTCPLAYVNGHTVSGFNMMDAFGLTNMLHGTVNAVSMEPGTFNSFDSFKIHHDAIMVQPTKNIHPEGLHPDYTISLLFRLLPESNLKPFALWQVLDVAGKPQRGIALNSGSKELLYFYIDEKDSHQTVKFIGPEIQKIFFGSFHKIHFVLTNETCRLYLDCKLISQQAILRHQNLSTDGVEVLGRALSSRGPQSGSVSFQLQMFEILCSVGWPSRDKCCELPSLRDEEKCPALPHACTCSTESKGPPGSSGPLGSPGKRGLQGGSGMSGPTGVMGTKGEVGPAGPPGPPGPQGPPGLSLPGEPGTKGERGKKGSTGSQGVPGPRGTSGSPGSSAKPGPRGHQGKQGNTGPRGPPGQLGQPGQIGLPGEPGSPGQQGNGGRLGQHGSQGEKGDKGDPMSHGMVRAMARQICRGLLTEKFNHYNNLLNHAPQKNTHKHSVTGPAGPPGPPGSAGRPGVPGRRGAPGFPGSSGLMGAMGPKGTFGKKGEKGEQGPSSQGWSGPPGPPGIPGKSNTGSTGRPGHMGPRGSPGLQGSPGKRGPPGQRGYCDSSQCNTIYTAEDINFRK